MRQRIAIEIWSNYQDYICARLKFADPTPDKQRANEDEAVTNAAEQELHYMHSGMPSRHIYTGPTSPSSWESNARAARHCATHSTQTQALCTIIPPPKKK